MIRYLEYEQIDKVKWDKCIDNSVNKLIYAYSWYLDIVCGKWEALVEDDYISVFPFNVGKKYGICYLYQPFFSQQLGVFSVNTINYNLVNSFLEEISARYKFIEINLNTLNKFKVHPDISGLKYKVEYNSNYELRLGSDYDSIQKLYSLNHKRNIKKARLSDPLIFGEPDITEVISLFRNNRGKYINHLTDKHYNILKNIIKICQDKGICKIFGAYIKKEPAVSNELPALKDLCAGIVLIETSERAIFLFSGSNLKAKDNGAMYILIDNYIKQNVNKELILDFEGSNDKNLARFYKGFGAGENKYLSIKRNTLPLHIKTALKFVKWGKEN